MGRYLSPMKEVPGHWWKPKMYIYFKYNHLPLSCFRENFLSNCFWYFWWTSSHALQDFRECLDLSERVFINQFSDEKCLVYVSFDDPLPELNTAMILREKTLKYCFSITNCSPSSSKTFRKYCHRLSRLSVIAPLEWVTYASFTAHRAYPHTPILTLAKTSSETRFGASKFTRGFYARKLIGQSVNEGKFFGKN